MSEDLIIILGLLLFIFILYVIVACVRLAFGGVMWITFYFSIFLLGGLARKHADIALDYIIKFAIFVLVTEFIKFIYRTYKENKWHKQLTSEIEAEEYDNLLFTLAEKLKSIDKNKKKYCHTKLDLSNPNDFFKLSKFPLDSLYYYSQRKTRKTNFFNKFGIALFKEGFLFSLERLDLETHKYYEVSDCIKFNEIVRTQHFGATLEIHLSRNDKKVIFKILQNETTIPLKKLRKFLDSLIKNKITHLVIKNLDVV